MPSARTEIAVAESGQENLCGGWLPRPPRSGGGPKRQALCHRRNSSRAGRRLTECTNTTRRVTVGSALRPAYNARRAGGRRARRQDPRDLWHRLAWPQHPSARGLRSKCQLVDGARLCPDGARPLGGRHARRAPLSTAIIRAIWRLNEAGKRDVCARNQSNFQVFSSLPMKINGLLEA
jgi:hypothetical protein